MAFTLRNSDDEFEQYRRKREAERRLDPDGSAGQFHDDDGKPEKVNARSTFDIDIKPVGPVRKALGSLFGILALICFVSLFAMAFLFMPLLEEHDLVWLLPAGFGGTFCFAGLAIWSGGAGMLPLLFASIGGVILGVSLVFGFGTADIKNFMMAKGIPILAGLAFAVAGLGLVIVPRVLYKKHKARYTVPVEACVIKKNRRRSRNHDGHTHVYYYLVWRYTAGGKEYIYQSNFGRSPEKRDVGHVGRLWLDPDDPGRVWEGGGTGGMAIETVLGALFFFAGCFVIAAMLGLFG